MALALLFLKNRMSDDSHFQEKADWKGKLKAFFGRFSRKSRQDPDATAFADSPLSDDSSAPPPQPPSFPEQDLPMSDEPRGERTLTGLIAMAWNDKVRPRISRSFGRGLEKGLGGVKTVLSPSGVLAAQERAFDPRTLTPLALLLAIFLVAYIGSDLTAMLLEKYIPEPPALRGSRFSDAGRVFRNQNDYQVIVNRNLFNSRGLIPGDEIPGNSDQNNTPVKTSLPLNLIGTLVMRNELRSIATIEDKGDQQVYPMRVDDEIPGKLRILSIEAYKVIFINTASGRREFVDMPEDQVAAPTITLGTPKKAAGPGDAIAQTAPSQFNLPRPEIDKALSNINEILTQARAIPHMENGQPAGYKLIQIVPGSIYSKLGLQNGDVLCGVNGEPINDPGRAFELLGTLKTSPHMELCVKREGKTSNFTYDIR